MIWKEIQKATENPRETSDETPEERETNRRNDQTKGNER